MSEQPPLSSDQTLSFSNNIRAKPVPEPLNLSSKNLNSTEASDNTPVAPPNQSANPYEDEEDYLEFRLQDSVPEGVIKFDHSDSNSPVRIIRHSLSERPTPTASPFSADSFTPTARTPNAISTSTYSSAPSPNTDSLHKLGAPFSPASDTTTVLSKNLLKNNSTANSKIDKQSTEETVQSSATNSTIKSPRQEHLLRLARKQQIEQGILDANGNKIEDEDSKTARSRKVSVSSNQSDNLKSSGVMNTPSSKDATTDSDSDLDWQEMPTVASYEVFDEKGKKVVFRHDDYMSQHDKTVGEDDAQGGSRYGYTRVTRDDDVKSISSMDENTDFLFDEDEFKRSPLAQLEATKKMLSDSQRIAYVGLCKLAMFAMATEVAQYHATRRIAKRLSDCQQSLARWSQLMAMRLYAHMDISPDEQKMIEQLSAHGIEASDLAPSLMKASKVENPFADSESKDKSDIESSEEEDEVMAEKTLDPSAKTVSDLHYVSPDAYKDDATIDIDIKWTVLCDLFLVLISDSVYDSRSRTLFELVGQYLGVSSIEVAQFEKKVTDALEIDEASKQTWRETEIMEQRRKKALKKKYVYVGLATLGGGLVLGLSAGLLAPVIGAGIAAGLSTVGISGTAGFLAGAGGTAIVTTTGAAIGSKIGLTGMNSRMGHVKTFEFTPLHNNKRVNLIITVSGWLMGKEDDIRLPFSTVDPDMGDLYSLLWEPEMLRSMGQTMNIIATEVITQSIQQILGSTILIGLMASIQLPMALSKLSYLLDNPWNVSLDRAWASGLVLADTLIRRNLGIRPVTLVGFSLGARVIYSCLVELARQGAYGLVQNVFIFGAPVVVKREQFTLARSVVAGRFVNGYSKKDWVLAYLFRATSGGIGKVAGLRQISEVYGIESLDCTEHVVGHMGYRVAMPILLKQLGWEVFSEEFVEIEDPDPEQHRERQRQLIEEFDVAKKQMERDMRKKKKKSLFKWRLKPKEKELWEMYELELETAQKQEERDRIRQLQRELTGENGDADSVEGSGNKEDEPSTLFDVDAIRQELENLSKSDNNVIEIPNGGGTTKLPKFDFSKDEVPIPDIPSSASSSSSSISQQNKSAVANGASKSANIQMTFIDDDEDDGYLFGNDINDRIISPAKEPSSSSPSSTLQNAPGAIAPPTAAHNHHQPSSINKPSHSSLPKSSVAHTKTTVTTPVVPSSTRSSISTLSRPATLSDSSTTISALANSNNNATTSKASRNNSQSTLPHFSSFHPSSSSALNDQSSSNNYNKPGSISSVNSSSTISKSTKEKEEEEENKKKKEHYYYNDDDDDDFGFGPPATDGKIQMSFE